jgi:uncharacterized protein YjbJ (UPF0337 family)
MGKATDTAGNATDSAMGTAKDAMGNAKDTAGNATDSAMGTAKDAMGNAKDTASKNAEDLSKVRFRNFLFIFTARKS